MGRSRVGSDDDDVCEVLIRGRDTRGTAGQ
jgi:hypothetical protein